MIDTHTQASNEMHTMLFDEWTKNPCTEDIPMVWGDVVASKQGGVDYNSGAVPYLRVELLYETSRKTSLKSRRGAKREHRGTLVAHLHTQSGLGYSNALPFISVAQDTFDGIASPGGVWFRNPQITNIGRQGTWYVTSMTVTFMYDLIR